MNKHSPSVLIKKEMLKIWNFLMKQTKNPNTQFEIQIGEKGKSWKTNLWIVAHGGSGLFPSSDELFFFEIILLRRSVWQWWRFSMKEERKQRNGVNRQSVWRWWRFGVKEERKQSKWREPASVRAGCGSSAWRRFFVSVKEVVKEAVFVREGFLWETLLFFCCVELFFDMARSHWRGVKHWFYATPRPNVFS